MGEQVENAGNVSDKNSCLHQGPGAWQSMTWCETTQCMKLEEEDLSGKDKVRCLEHVGFVVCVRGPGFNS